MSVLDQLKELDQKREELLATGKAVALKKAEAAISELNELGFKYKLTGGPTASTGKRRSGIRDEVLSTIKSSPSGITRAVLLEALGAKGDKSAEQSISNALSALKKQDAVTSDDGVYKVVA